MVINTTKLKKILFLQKVLIANQGYKIRSIKINAIKKYQTPHEI